jgi:hypoxanthine phosphoribosyltransferase
MPEHQMNPHSNVMLRPFIDESGIRLRVRELAHEIEADFKGNEIVLIGTLKGSFLFAADLVRCLYRRGIPMVIDFVQVSSYGSKTVSSGNISMIRDVTADIEGRFVLLVDDILDTGRTIGFLTNHLLAKRPCVLRTAVLLDKPARRVGSFRADYAGFRVPDAFIVGYGLDYDNRYREQPGLSIVSFGDRGAESAFAFRIADDVIFLSGRLDAAGALWIRDTLIHWKGNLILNFEALDGIGPEGVDLLRTVSGASARTGQTLVLLKIPEKLRKVLIQGRLENQIMD